MSEYYTHEEAKTNCPEGSHVAYHRTSEETESPFGWRWCVVTPPPSIVAEPWVPTEPVTLEAAVKIADEWTAGCNRWAAFENMPSEPKHLRWCWHGAKFLALAQENSNTERIERERARLMSALESWVDAGRPTEPAPEIEPEAYAPAHQDGLGMGTKCALAIGAGVVLGHALRGSHGHHGALGRAITYAAVSQVAKPAFASLFKAATR